METILEQQRRYHEEKERLMDVMAKEMLTKKSTVSGPGQGLPVRLGPMLGVPSLGGLSGTLRLTPLPLLGAPRPRSRLGNFTAGPSAPGLLV